MLDLMLSEGHLSEYERLYRHGELVDYPFFPGGKLLKGRCNPRQTRGPMDRRTALEQFHALEVVAKIPSIPGRGWYGIRRISVDIADTLTADDEVKDALGGWQNSDTRKRIYRDDVSNARRAAARDIRDVMRSRVDVEPM
jgi:hypothetical protein